MKNFKRVVLKAFFDSRDPCTVCTSRNNPYSRKCEDCRNHDNFTFDGYIRKDEGDE